MPSGGTVLIDKETDIQQVVIHTLLIAFVIHYRISHLCKSKKNYGSQFSLSIMWDRGRKFRLWSLLADTFTHWPIFLATYYSLILYPIIFWVLLWVTILNRVYSSFLNFTLKAIKFLKYFQLLWVIKIVTVFIKKQVIFLITCEI